MTINKYLLISVLGILLFADFYFLAQPAHAVPLIDVACNKFHYPWCKPSGASQNPGELIEEIYMLGLGLSGAAAFGVIIFGAILYTVSAGNASTQGEARKWMEGGLWGLGLLLGAYLILYTINPGLVNNLSTDFGVVPERAEPSRYGVSNTTLSSNTVLDDTGGRKLAQEIGVKFKDNVSFQNVRLSTMDELRQLQTDYKASSYNADLLPNLIYVTSVTEGSHALGPQSHASGNKFDLRPNSTLDFFIRSTYTRVGTRSDGSVLYQSPRGTIYADEPATGKPGDANYQPRHWDVLVRS